MYGIVLAAAWQFRRGGGSQRRSGNGRARGTGGWLLAVLQCVAACVAVATLPGHVFAADYFVSASADPCSTRTGTRTSPYCTVTAALAAHHVPGTTIFVLPGVYREQVTLPASGAPGAPIRFEAEPQDGAPVVVDGSDDFSDPSLWSPATGGAWLASSVTWAPEQVFADSVRLALSTAPPDSLPPRSFTYVPGAGLYVNLNGDDPGRHAIAVGRRSYGFFVSNRTWVSITGFTVIRSEIRGIQLTNAANVAIDHNTIAFSATDGIQLRNSSAVHLGANTFADNADDGVSVTSGSTGCTIEGNECARNGTPQPRAGSGISVEGSNGNVIQSNRLHHNQVSGEDLRGGASGNVSIQNRSWNNGLAGFNHLGAPGNLHNGDVAFGNTGDGFAMNKGSSGQTIHNCIAAMNGTVHSRYDLVVDSTSAAGLNSDDNIFWMASGSATVRYMDQPFRLLSDYTAASGQDIGTSQLDPLFVDPEAGDFRLQPRSPAIDAANTATPGWPASDADGQSRIDDPFRADVGLGPVSYADRGALECVPGATPPPVDTVPRLDHIIVIIMENKPYDMVRVAPYTADLVAHSSSFAGSYAYAHQSQSDYYAFWGAVGRRVTESICPAVGSPYLTENLGHLCEAHGRTWRAYSEGLPAAGDPVCHVHNYVRRHCPWTDWGNLDHMNERPYEDLAIDIANGTLPDLAIVVPDVCNDTHNDCGQDTIQIGDDWLSRNVPAMIDAVGPRGLVILTWDEDDGSDGNHILTVFSSPLARTGYVSGRFINHFVLTRTICDALGLPAFAEAAAFDPITDVWLKSSTPPPPPLLTTISLGLAIPNPSRGAMTTTVELPSRMPFEAAIFDLTGRRVKTILYGPQSGHVQVAWDGADGSGRPAHSGVYMLRVRAGSTTLGRKLLLVR